LNKKRCDDLSIWKEMYIRPRTVGEGGRREREKGEKEKEDNHWHERGNRNEI
jgi:hypothetical protein